MTPSLLFFLSLLAPEVALSSDFARAKRLTESRLEALRVKLEEVYADKISNNDSTDCHREYAELEAHPSANYSFRPCCAGHYAPTGYINGTAWRARFDNINTEFFPDRRYGTWRAGDAGEYISRTPIAEEENACAFAPPGVPVFGDDRATAWSTFQRSRTPATRRGQCLAAQTSVSSALEAAVRDSLPDVYARSFLIQHSDGLWLQFPFLSLPCGVDFHDPRERVSPDTNALSH
jgi:hypothetical protein